MPRAQDPRGVPADRQPGKGMGGPIPDFGQYTDFTDTLGRFVEGLLKNIKDWTGIDLYWMLDWSWTTNTILEVIRQANDLTAWLQNPIQRPPNLLTRPSFSSPSAIAAAPDWFWDPVVSLGTLTGPDGLPRTDPQGSARTIADGSVHSMLSNAISERSALTPGQILTCQIHVLVEDGFTASDDQAIRLEVVPSRLGVLQEPVVVAHCGVPDGDPADWISAPVDSKAVFFDVDWVVPETDSLDTVELRVVVSESAGGDVPVRFDEARVAAAGGFLVVLADLFDAGRRYLTDSWKALEKWLNSSFAAEDWTTLAAELQAAWDRLFVDVNRALRILGASDPFGIGHIFQTLLTENPLFGWIVKIATIVGDYLGAVFEAVMWWFFGLQVGGPYAGVEPSTFIGDQRAPFSSALWDHLVTVFVDGFRDMAVALLEALGIDVPDEVEDKPLSDIIRALLVENPVVGWLFKIGFAVTDWVGDLWTGLLQWMFGVGAGTPYPDATVGTGSTDDRKAFSKALWDNLITICTDGFDAMVIKILEALGMTQPSDGKDRSLNAIIKAMLMENPVVGWLFKIGFALQDWVKESWDALADWILGDPTFVGSAKDKLPFSSALWDSMASRLSAAWTTLLDAINDAIDGEVKYLSSLADIIRNLLVENPVFGWLFKIGYAVTDYLTETFDAIADWAFGGFTTALWNSMQTRMNAAWTVMTDAIGDALDKTFTRNKSPNDLISDALKSNPWFGWLFDMVDDWLQPILTIGKAVADWGAAVWTAISTFAGSPTGGAWNTMVTAITTAWNTMVDAIFAAWGSDKTHADVVNPAVATEAALKNNPVTGWLFAGSGGTSWLTLFDPARKFINQMVQGLHWGYFDASWVWVVSWTTPSTALPGSGAVMTPGRTDGDGTGLATTVDSTIPAAPTGLIAVPWPDLTVPNFPAGGITYAIAAVKSGVEGPATQVSVFATTLIPPNRYGHVDLAWNAVTGATGYRIYRKVDATYQATDWRLIGSPTSASSVLLPWQDKIVRTAGTVAHPKTDAELSAQIVTDVQTTALGAEATAGAAQATATAAGTNIQATMDAVSIGATGDPTLSSVSMPTVQGSVDGLRQTGADNAESLSDILAKINGVPASPGLTPSPSTTTASSSSSAWGSGWTFYSSPSGVTGRALAGNGWYIGTESGSLSQGMGIVTTQLLNSDGSLPTRWTAVAGVDGIPSSVFGETNNSALVFGGAVSNTLGSYRLYARLYGSKIEVGYCTGFTRTVLSTYTYATGSSAMLTLGLKPGTISGKWTVYATTSNGRCYTQATNVTLPFTPGGYFGSGLTAGTSGTPPRIRSLQAVTIEADTVPGIVGRFTASGGVLTTSQVTIFPWNVSGSPYFVSTNGPGASGAGHGVLFNYPGMYNIQVNVPFTNGPDNDTTVALRSYLNSNIVTDYQEQQGSYSISSKAKRFQWNYQLPVAAGTVFACGIATNKELSTPQAVIYISRAGIFS